MGKERETPIGFWDWTFYSKNEDNLFLEHKTNTVYENTSPEKMYRLDGVCWIVGTAVFSAAVISQIGLEILAIYKGLMIWTAYFFGYWLLPYAVYRKYPHYQKLVPEEGVVKKLRRQAVYKAIIFLGVLAINIIAIIVLTQV